MSIPPALLVLDAGTSACRAALLREGMIVASERRSLDIVFPAPGHAEQDPRALASVAADVIARVIAQVAPGESVVLGIANQRSTIILWDADTGRPFGPASFRYGFEDVGLERVIAQTIAVNARSRAVMERVGLRYVRAFPSSMTMEPSGQSSSAKRGAKPMNHLL